MPTTEFDKDTEIPSQNSYRETPYEDASWEIVGDAPPELKFVPLEFQIISEAQDSVDPMFADYGGLVESKSGKRWHLPENLTIAALAEEKSEDTPEEVRHSLSEEELQAIIAEAEARGKERGVQEQKQVNQEQLDAVQARLQAILSDLQKQVSENLKSIEKQAVTLSVDISEKIIGQIVEINPEYIVKVLQESISLSSTAVINKIRVSPEDLEFIEIVGIQKQLKVADQTWHFEADPGIKAGCVVETSAGEVDYQLDRAWNRVKENIVRVIK